MLVLVTCVEQEDVVHYIIFYHLIDQQWYLCNSNICIVCGTIKKGSKMYLLDYSTHFFFFFFSEIRSHEVHQKGLRHSGQQVPMACGLNIAMTSQIFKKRFSGLKEHFIFIKSRFESKCILERCILTLFAVKDVLSTLLQTSVS